MILFFNVAKEKEASVYLVKNGKILDRLRQKGDFKISDYLLVLIDKLLQRNKINFKDLKGIITVSGPGPFTSVRIGAAVANALSFALKIPIIGIEMKKQQKEEQIIKTGLQKFKKAKIISYIKPVYGGKANITRPKR
jgi:tRNA threonylcarbamoyl adenosine modification protein YeaZ